MLNFEIQSNGTLSETVYEELKNLILTGKIKPGTRVMDVKLAEDFGISRTPIREAIWELENDGLVVNVPRKAVYISKISDNDILNILEVRATLEGLATACAAKHMNGLEIEELQLVSAKFDLAVVDCDIEEMIRIDTEFHHLIAETSRNKYLKDKLGQLQNLVLLFGDIYYKDLKRAEYMVREHKNILYAILKKDETACVK